MKIMRTRAIAKKEWLQVRRDYLSLAMAFLLPVILLLIYAYAITLDVHHIKTVICDRDKSSLSRELIAEFGRSEYFSLVADVDSYSSVDRYLNSGDARVALLIPSDFGKSFRTGRQTTVEVVVDGSESNTATIAQGYVAGVAELFGNRYRKEKLVPVIDLRSRVWYNPELKSRNFLIPGLIAIIMSVIIALLISLTISREWDRGTMEQLISTPVRVSELIVGKMVPYFIIGFADTLIAVVISTLFLKVPLRGSIILLTGVSAIFLFGGLSFGVLISIIAKNQLVASQMAILSSFLPSFMLSGFIFPISNMPVVLQAITYIVPARYFVSVLKGVFLKGTGIKVLFLEVLFLCLYAVVVFVVANKKFKKRIE
jgi:ABC-2 type transport system permease protein